MGRDTVKYFAAKLFLSEEEVKDRLKRKVFDFLYGDASSVEQSMALEKDKVTVLAEQFINSDTGREYFGHSPATGEWNRKCTKEQAIQSLAGLVKLWQKNKMKTAKRNDVSYMLNNPKLLASPSVKKTGQGIMNSLESPILLPDEDHSPPANWSQEPNLPITRRDTIETEDMYGPLHDIPYRAEREQTEETEDPEEDPELPDAADIIARPSSPHRRAKSPTIQTMSEEPADKDQSSTSRLATASSQVLLPPRTPMHLAATHSNSELPSPPITGRKRTHDELTSEKEQGHEDVATSKGAMSKKVRYTLTLDTETQSTLAAHMETEKRDHTTFVAEAESTANTSVMPRTLPSPTTARNDQIANPSSYTPATEAKTAADIVPIAARSLEPAAVAPTISSSFLTPISPVESRSPAPPPAVLPQPNHQPQHTSHTLRDMPRSEPRREQLRFSRFDLVTILDYLHEHRQAANLNSNIKQMNHIQRKKLQDTKIVLTYLRDDVEKRISHLDDTCLEGEEEEDCKMHG